MIATPTDIFSQLRRDEGLSLTVKPDTGNTWQIGYGRNLTRRGISRAEAESMLATDVRECADELATMIPWSAGLSLPRQGVLLNMVYEMGIVGLLGFKTFLTLMEAEKWDEASLAMLDSEWARQQAPSRAARLAVQVEHDEWV